MFFVLKPTTMGKTKRNIKNLIKNNQVEPIDKDDMKNILGGREKMSKLRKIYIGFTDIMPL